MKKALSIVLSVLVLFSMFSMAVSAADLVTVKFVVDEETVYEIQTLPGVNFVDRLQQGEQKLETPTKESTETTRYIFKHWLNKANGHTAQTGNIPAASEDTVYVAVFHEENIEENQTFWVFLRTIFERINMIFEYFARVFEGVIEF